MSDTLPAPSPPASLLAPLTDPAGGSALTRLRSFTGQAGVRRMLPLFLGAAAIGGAALTWSALAPSAQRTLYSQLADSERAGVVAALDKAGITYSIDNQSGSLSVAEGDFYRARMLVASDGALATPESGSQMLDKLPMGASRTMEGERLRAARERDLTLTIGEIDGVEAVRVHLAEAEKSVFVRDDTPPTASVMLRLAQGRQLSDSQVGAIVNLVAASVPGLSPDAVRVVDQHGKLLTDRQAKDDDRLELQARLEEKLRRQIAQLLTPMLGEGNFTSEIQVDLDMDQVTSARESYDKDGVVRSETQQSSSTAGSAAAGVPGVLSNTPPPAAKAMPGPPAGAAPAASGDPPVNGEASTSRTYELGREVSVANTAPGKLRRLSVAVAISGKALKNKNADVEQIKQLVSAAVGLDARRGDQVAVMARDFSPVDEAALPFYESAWFASVLRNVGALLGLLLVLLLGVRPLIKALRRPDVKGEPEGESYTAGSGDGEVPDQPDFTRPIDPAWLSQQVGLAQQLVAAKPENAVAALREMLGNGEAGAAA